MGLCLSTTTCLLSTRQRSPHNAAIHILDDDSLLNIFCLYRPFFLGEDEKDAYRLQAGKWKWVEGCWWYRLTHVCQRWRNLILSSASHLRLSLVCTNGTPVENMLTYSLPLPLTVDYSSEGGISVEDERGMLLALEQRHRIRHLRLSYPDQILRKLVMEIDGEFPILEYLVVYPTVYMTAESTAVFPETLQAPHLRHLALTGFACSIRPRLHPTTASLVTLSLIINHPPAYFQPNILLQWISFLPQLEDLEIAFTFPVPNRDVERQLTHTPIMTHTTLPNLRYFRFQGVSAYLEAVVCRITTPRLKRLRIQLFNQLTFSIPRLSQFMDTTENLRIDSADVIFKDKFVYVETGFRGVDTYVVYVKVDCQHPAWQVSFVVQFCNALSQAFSVVEHLTLGHDVHSQSSEEHNDVDRIEWRNLLRSFNNLKTLFVEEGLIEELSHCLRLEDGELPLEILPELQELTYIGGRDTDDAFASFINARQDAGRPVALVRHSTSPSPSPSPLFSAPPAIVAAPSNEAGNDIET